MTAFSDKPYRIMFDTLSMTLNIVTEGFWSAGTTATFSTELLARGTTARLYHGQFVVLADLRKAAIQSTTVISTLEIMMPKALQIISAPIVAVVSSTLVKLQTERYLNFVNCKNFPDIDSDRF